MPIRDVEITLTSRTNGNGLVRSYPVQSTTVFRVPLYQLVVAPAEQSNREASSTFDVVRFGVLKRTRNSNPRVVGLRDPNTYTLRWRYSPNLREYNWSLVGHGLTGTHLIHDGADDPQRTALGAIGCIEITGRNGWNNFQAAIFRISGSNDSQAISDEEKLSLIVEADNGPGLVPVPVR